MKRIILKDGTTFVITILSGSVGYGTTCKDNNELDSLISKMSNSNLSEYKIVTEETGESEVIKDKTVTGIRTFQAPGKDIKVEFYISNQDNTAVKLEEAKEKISELEISLAKQKAINQEQDMCIIEVYQLLV